MAGWPVTFGSRGAPEGVSEESELVVDALVRAGFVLCGRTNTPEFGVLTVAENSRYGISRNPWDTEPLAGRIQRRRRRGGGGGMFPIAHANDGGGSIRIPASYCGLVGLKPSRGRVPRLAQSWLGAVVEGVVAHTVADAAAVLDATAAWIPLAWYNAPAPARAFAGETDTPPGTLRIGLMAQAPLGIPTDEACAARRTRGGGDARGARARGRGGRGADRLRRDDPVRSSSLTRRRPGRLRGRRLVGGRAAHRPPASRARSEIGAYDYVLAARTLELLSRREVARWGRDFDVLAHTRPPRSCRRWPARCSRRSTRRPTSRCWTSCAASRSRRSATSPACPP